MVHLNPAQYIVHVFGGVRKTARAIGRNPSAVSRWISRDKGAIPGLAIPNILKAATENKLDITSDDILKGRKIKQDK